MTKCHDFSSFRIQTYLGTEELQIFAIYMYMYFMNSPKWNTCLSKIFSYNKFLLYFISVPSQAPSGLTVAASTSTSITASWQLPPEYARHGNITGFKLFYNEKDSVGSPFNITMIDGGSYTTDIIGLSIYTEYEFQVLAFTSKGDGPKSSVVVERTAEDGKNLLTYTNRYFDNKFHAFQGGVTIGGWFRAHWRDLFFSSYELKFLVRPM